MQANTIRFDDGAAYEQYMGIWSRLAGEQFLDWLAPAAGWRWLDVGCGNGAFTETLLAGCAPASVHGVDPAEAQLAYARSRPALQGVLLQPGDAMALPFADRSFDAAVMPLVIFFVPDPAKGVAEMVRCVDAGGCVSAYAWDMPGGGFPYAPLLAEIRALGIEVPQPPSPDASRLDTLQALWQNAGLQRVQTQAITVQRRFADFDDYWRCVQGAPSVGTLLAAMDDAQLAALKAKLRARLPQDASGGLPLSGRAHAVRGYVAG